MCGGDLAEHLLVGGVIHGVEFDLLDRVQLPVQLVPATGRLNPYNEDPNPYEKYSELIPGY